MNPNSVNNFYGQKLSKLGINVAGASDTQLLWKDDYDNDIKTWYGTKGPVMEEGQLPHGGFGLYFPDSNGTGVAQFGEFPDGSIALKVAKPGIEVATASDSELIFNSSQDMFKIVASGTQNTNSVTITFVTYNQWITKNTGYTSIPHGLDFAPAIIAYGVDSISGPTEYLPLPWTGLNAATTAPGYVEVSFISVYAWTDSSNIYFEQDVTALSTAAGSTTYEPFSVKYYLLQETAT